MPIGILPPQIAAIHPNNPFHDRYLIAGMALAFIQVAWMAIERQTEQHDSPRGFQKGVTTGMLPAIGQLLLYVEANNFFSKSFVEFFAGHVFGLAFTLVY